MTTHDSFSKFAQTCSGENELFSLFFENIPDCIYFKDRESRFVCASRALAEMLGVHDVSKLIGKTDFDFFPPEQAQEAFDDEQLMMRTGQPLVGKVEKRMLPDGQTSWAITTKMPLRNATGEIVGTCGISKDFTSHKEMQDNLAELNKRLEVSSYIIAHDLCSPLQVVKGFGHLVATHCAENADSTGCDYVQRIVTATQRMDDLITELMDHSKITFHELSKEDVDMGGIARAVVGELQQREPHRKVECIIADSLGAFADRVLIRTVIENLLGNAWKFTSKKEQARIEFGRLPDQDVFFVKDNGAGFRMEQADKVFAMCKRLHSNAEFPGTGVGLASVESAIHKHGGKIWAEAAVDQGATFFFQLPPGNAGAPVAPRQGSVAPRDTVASATPQYSRFENLRWLFDFLLENIPVRIYFKDKQNRFIRGSRALAEFVGVSDPSQLIGKADSDFFTEEHVRAASDDERQIMRTGEPIVGKVEKETLPGGQVCWAITTKMPLRNAEGDIIGTCGISKDFTTQKALEEELAKSHQALARRQEQLQHALTALNSTHENLRTIQNQLVEAEKTQALGELALEMAKEMQQPLDGLNARLDSLAGLPALGGDASHMAVIEEMRAVIRQAGDRMRVFAENASKRDFKLDAGDLRKTIGRAMIELDLEERWLLLEKLPEGVAKYYVDGVSGRS